MLDSDNNKKQRHHRIRKASTLEQVHKSAKWHMFESSKAFFLTEQEMRVRLERKTDVPEWIEAAITQLKEYNYIKSDQDFADDFIEKAYFGEYGQGHIVKVLMRKHISRRLILERVAFIKSQKNIDESLIVKNYVNTYYPDFNGKSREEVQNRLTKRGFTLTDIKSAIAQHVDHANLLSKMQLKANKVDLASEIIKGERRHKGLRAIKLQLKAKQVDVSNLSIIANELARNDEIDFFAKCLECLVSYIKKKRLDLDAFKDKTRLYAHLSQRGYSSEEIKYGMTQYQCSLSEH